MKYNCLIVSGFLDSGKTTYIKKYLKDSKHQILLLVCEQGEVEYDHQDNVVIKYLDTNQLTTAFFDYNMYDEIIIEYNDTWSSQKLFDLKLDKHCKVKWIHLIDGTTFEYYFKNLYELFVDKIIQCDELIVTKTHNQHQIKNFLKPLNPKLNKNYALYIAIITFILGYLLDREKFITIFSSIILQAIPFLIFGVLISSVIQFYLNEQKLIQLLSKFSNFMNHVITSVISGLLPVCDCATVPIAIGLANKKVPISQVIIFILTSTSLNPIVILSTNFAFNDWQTPLLRIVLTLVIAIVVAMLYRKPTTNYLKNTFSGISCSTGYLGKSNSKFELFLRHATFEFIRMIQYIFIGAFCSTIVQLLLFENQNLILNNPLFSFILVIIMSLFVSVCATSNAFIAKSFAMYLPYPLVILFMCLGPMLDIKNLLLLEVGFNRRFMLKYIISLLVIAIIITGIGVLL